jgi:hypothetical protein
MIAWTMLHSDVLLCAQLYASFVHEVVSKIGMIVVVALYHFNLFPQWRIQPVG